MRAGRLLAILLRLQQGDATAAALARELEVSTRTIYRDVVALQAAGVPLWTEGGHGGGIRLLEGWRTELDGLTGPEAGALFLSALPDAAAELGLGAVMAAAQTKVLATLPPELRGSAARVRERFHVDAPGWFRRPEAVPCLAALADAVWRTRRVVIGYRRGERRVTRRLDPLGLVLKAGVWYFVAASEAVRTYRVGRVLTVEVLDEEARRPARFDLAGWWAASAADFDRSILGDVVRLRLSPLGARRLAEVTDVGAAARALAGASLPGPDGWVEVVLAVEALDVARHQLVALGQDVEVLEPDSLRGAFVALGETIAARHRRPSSPSSAAAAAAAAAAVAVDAGPHPSSPAAQPSPPPRSP